MFHIKELKKKTLKKLPLLVGVELIDDVKVNVIDDVIIDGDRLNELDIGASTITKIVQMRMIPILKFLQY